MSNLQTATFDMGCFWCSEAVFQKLKGVESVLPGYMGGDVENPTSNEVYYNETGHVEVAQIKYDPSVIEFSELLEIFWHVHDPTTLNRQQYDIGKIYRSVIFYHDEEQKRLAEESKRIIEEAKLYPDPVVTTIEPAKEFYEAEDYHKNYFKNNKDAPYCRVIIKPKLDKLEKLFKEKLK